MLWMHNVRLFHDFCKWLLIDWNCEDCRDVPSTETMQEPKYNKLLLWAGLQTAKTAAWGSVLCNATASTKKRFRDCNLQGLVAFFVKRKEICIHPVAASHVSILSVSQYLAILAYGDCICQYFYHFYKNSLISNVKQGTRWLKQCLLYHWETQNASHSAKRSCCSSRGMLCSMKRYESCRHPGMTYLERDVTNTTHKLLLLDGALETWFLNLCCLPKNSVATFRESKKG